jgi:hypothetical protein
VSTYLGAWDITPGQTLAEAIAEAKQQLPAMLDAERVELIGEPHWRIGLILTADAVPARDSYIPPWETPLALIADLMPEVGWQVEWDRRAA